MSAPVTIGLDLGGTFLKAGVIGPHGDVLQRARHPVDSASVGKVFDIIGRAVRGCSEAYPEAAAVGLGIPGIFNQAEQKIMNSPNLHCLDAQDLPALMGPVCPLPFLFDNDANCAAYGEFRAGAGHVDAEGPPRSFVLLTIGTGVGGGIIIDGRLWHGARGYAGEPGHMVIDRNGKPCPCGGQGCLETLVSATALVEAYRVRGGAAETSKEVFHKAVDGDHEARAAFDEIGRNLGIGLSVIINLLNPEVIAVGGGVMGAGELLLGPARSEAQRRAFRESFLATRILPATLGNDAGQIGAGLMARELLR